MINRGDRTVKTSNFLRILWALSLFPLALFADELEIKEVIFTGGGFEGREEMEDIVRTEEGDDFDARMVKLDKILITNYYRQNGFIEAEVYDSVAISLDRTTVTVKYRIESGRRYYYNEVIFRGNSEISSVQLAEQFEKAATGNPFDESLLNEAVRNVENLYYNSGKPFVVLDARYQYEQDSLVNVILDIEENETVFIGDIRYLGLDKVQEFIVRRELEIKKGEKYNRKAIEKSQRNIYSTNLFRNARIEIEPVKGQNSQVILKIHLQENDPRWIGVRFGVGYEEERSFGNTFDLTLQGGHRNLFGTARSISLHLTPSVTYDLESGTLHNPQNKIQLKYIEPWIGYTRTPGIFQVAYEQQRPLNSGSFDLWNISFDVNHDFENNHSLNGALSVKYVNELDDKGIDSAMAAKYVTDQSEIYSMTVYWKRDNRINIFYPVNSSYTDASITYSHSVGKVESEARQTNNYFTVVASWQRYQPFSPQVLSFKRWKFTLASRIKMGSIFEIGEHKKIPINDRFYAGGASTVRGYQERLLGPALQTDDQGKITKASGGKLLFVSNIEVRMPVVWIVVLETFLDGGYVWAELEDLHPLDVKFTTGLGIAFITPLGPVRFDYGHKLMRARQDPTRGAFHLGIYFAF
ncbi:MAG: BamA/TamA family outer membrane protein [Calditrichaceae bacterium]|nr:BamA/TamA family outer membrane protein [Calditrichaceae bacterium]MBN2708165.1 BamA/TamA family outer membrane protein [Calditrichaceae bacterium]RQV97163.1 MAG: hypothetical protein EH224_02220 [Calditrichota bacterium]